MKKKVLFMMGIVAMMGVFTSCSKDDNEDKKIDSTVLTDERALDILASHNLWVATSEVDGYEHVWAFHFTKGNRFTGYHIAPDGEVERYKDVDYFLLPTTAEAVENPAEEASEEENEDFTYCKFFASTNKDDLYNVNVGALHIITDGSRVEFYDGSKWIEMSTDMTLSEFEDKYKEELAIITKEQAMKILASSEIWMYEEEDGYICGIQFYTMNGHDYKYTSFSYDPENEFTGRGTGVDIEWLPGVDFELSSDNDSYASGNINYSDSYGEFYDSYRGLTPDSFYFCPSASSTGTKWYRVRPISYEDFYMYYMI